MKMKKFFLMAMAGLALTIASCTSEKKAQVEETEQTELATATDAIAAALEAGDASALQSALEAAKEKAAELVASNPEVAQEYLNKVQEFLKEQADKVTALVGDNEAVKAVVSAVTEAPVNQVMDGLKSLVDNANEAAEQKVEDVKNAATQAVEDAKAAAEDKVNEEVQNAKDKANDAINKGVDAAKEKLGLK